MPNIYRMANFSGPVISLQSASRHPHTWGKWKHQNRLNTVHVPSCHRTQLHAHCVHISPGRLSENSSPHTAHAQSKSWSHMHLADNPPVSFLSRCNVNFLTAFLPSLGLRCSFFLKLCDFSFDNAAFTGVSVRISLLRLRLFVFFRGPALPNGRTSSENTIRFLAYPTTNALHLAWNSSFVWLVGLRRWKLFAVTRQCYMIDTKIFGGGARWLSIFNNSFDSTQNNVLRRSCSLRLPLVRSHLKQIIGIPSASNSFGNTLTHAAGVRWNTMGQVETVLFQHAP